MPSKSGTHVKRLEKELADAVLTLSKLVTAISQVLIDRTAQSAALVDDEIMQRFTAAADDHMKAITLLREKLAEQ